jgi:hypothetical protein
MGDQDYSESQGPEGDYGGSQQPGTLYAGTGGAGPKPAPSPATPKVAPTKAVIHVGVNPGSMTKLAPFVSLLSKSPGIAPEFKGKIMLDKKTNTIAVPDYSGGTVIPGKEWLFDLGKAGDDWEITTATLRISLDGPTSMTFEEDIRPGDERGRPVSADPDDGVNESPFDFTGSPLVGRGIPLGFTIPNRTAASKNSSYTKSINSQVADLASKRGLIMITRRVVVRRRVGKDQKLSKPVTIPNVMIAMTFFHELSAHASFFETGQDAAHSDPPDVASNPVDRNAQQAEASYRKFVDKEDAAFQKKVQERIDLMLSLKEVPE